MIRSHPRSSRLVSGWPRALTTLAAALLVAAGLAGAQAPGAALAAAPDRWGFAFMDNPTPPPAFVVDVNRQAGTWPAGFLVTVDQLGLGRYVVHFPQIGTPKLPPGVVHVTAVNQAPVWCQAQAWGPTAIRDEDVFVACSQAGLGSVNSRFTVLFSESSAPPAVGGGDYAYVSLRPAATIVDQFNSAGAVNTVVAGPPGFWTVTLPKVGLPTAAGNIQVTAVDPAVAVRCKPLKWAPGVNDQVILVGCVDASNAPIDTGWTLSYQRERAIFGAVAPPKLFAYTFPTLGPVPFSDLNFNTSGATNAIMPAGLGLHLVQFPNVGALQDHVQVTAFAGSTEFCNLLTRWATSGGNAIVRDVACFDGFGKPSNTPAFTTYTSRF